MTIQINKIIDLSIYQGNPAPKVVQQLSIVHESTDGDITQYYIDTASAIENDKSSNALSVPVREQDDSIHYEYVDYNSLVWKAPSAKLTRRRIDRLGVKAFPNIGAIAHYKLFGQNSSKIVAPVSHKPIKYGAPTIAVQVNLDHSITITITPPNGVTYMCYRITLQLDVNRLEYVTYDTVITIPQVLVTGSYIIYATGYVNEGEITSADSNEVEANLVGQYSQWPIVLPGANIPQRLSELLDVNISYPTHHQLLRFNNDITKWENYTSASQDAPETAAHIVNVTYVNSKTVHVAVDNRLKSNITTSDVIITLVDNTPVVLSSVQVSDFYNAVVNTVDDIVDSFNTVVKKEAFLNPSTDTTPYLCTLQQHSIAEYAGQSVYDMTLVSFTSDSGKDAFTVPTNFTWVFNNERLSSIYISGDSCFGLNSVSEHIKLNRRDTYIALYRWQLYEEPIKMLRIRWEGWSPYNRRTDPYRYAWELFLFEDGNACLYLDSVGTSTTFSGTFTFNGLAYTISMSSQFATFRRVSESASGASASDWTYEAAPYTFMAS